MKATIQISFLRTQAPKTHHFQVEAYSILTATDRAREYLFGHVHGPYMRGENNYWVVCACPDCLEGKER
jgi:hypothetical protein